MISVKDLSVSPAYRSPRARIPLSTHGFQIKGDFPMQSLGLVHMEAAVWRFASKLNMKAILFQTHCKCEIIEWLCTSNKSLVVI